MSLIKYEIKLIVEFFNYNETHTEANRSSWKAFIINLDSNNSRLTHINFYGGLLLAPNYYTKII